MTSSGSVLISEQSPGAKKESEGSTIAESPACRKCDQSHELTVTSSLEEALHHLFPS